MTKKNSINPYGLFLGFVAYSVVAPIMTICFYGTMINQDITMKANIVITLLAILGAITFMLMLADKDSCDKDKVCTPKAIFWGWILFSVILGVTVVFGKYEMIFLRWIGFI